MPWPFHSLKKGFEHMESGVRNGGMFAFVNRSFLIGSFSALLIISFMVAAVGVGYQWGRSNVLPASPALVEALHASTAQRNSTMAVATGMISEDIEGIFFLDFLTGDLQCWVYYPRTGLFGAKYAVNVTAQLPGGKNPEYLLVTGASIPSHASNNARSANCLAYVVDVHSGAFAAYGVPWNISAEKSGQPQQAPLLPVGGGQIRDPLISQK
jgi:hypothetical protein